MEGLGEKNALSTSGNEAANHMACHRCGNTQKQMRASFYGYGSGCRRSNGKRHRRKKMGSYAFRFSEVKEQKNEQCGLSAHVACALKGNESCRLARLNGYYEEHEEYPRPVGEDCSSQ